MSKKEINKKEEFDPKDLKLGDKISFNVGKEKYRVTVDQDLLDLPIQKSAYYKKYGYKIEE